MTTAELISRLQDADPDGEKEVRFAYQESWPLQSSVRGAVAGAEVQDEDAEYEEDEERKERLESKYEDIVFVVEGSQVSDDPYAPREVFELAY